MINDTKSYCCPACGCGEHLAIIAQTEGYSNLESDGQYRGDTDYEGDHVTTGILCRSCGWRVTPSETACTRVSLLPLLAVTVDTRCGYQTVAEIEQAFTAMNEAEEAGTLSSEDADELELELLRDLRDIVVLNLTPAERG